MQGVVDTAKHGLRAGAFVARDPFFAHRLVPLTDGRPEEPLRTMEEAERPSKEEPHNKKEEPRLE